LGEAEVDIEVAGDRHSRIAVALSTDFRSECHLDDFFAATFWEFFNSIRQQRTFYWPKSSHRKANLRRHYAEHWFGLQSAAMSQSPTSHRARKALGVARPAYWIEATGPAAKMTFKYVNLAPCRAHAAKLLVCTMYFVTAPRVRRLRMSGNRLGRGHALAPCLRPLMEFAHGPERLGGLEEPTFARHNHVLGI